MNPVSLLFLPLVFGLVGAFTPCALGINAVFLGYITGKPRRRRLTEWTLFALARAAFLTVLGLAFGLLGQLVGDFVRGYQVVVAYGLILLGILFIASRFRPLPLPTFSLAPAVAGKGETYRTNRNSALAMGAIFGLDIPACTSPLVLALLAETVLVGNYLFGAVALFIFGVAMSLPLLVLGAYEGANRWLMKIARRYGTIFYMAAGGLLILVGVAELSPVVMSLVGGWVRFIVEPFLSG